MKAAVLQKLQSPLVVRNDVAVPPPARGQVLVELAFSGVCHSQLMEVRGKRGPDPYLPHLLGHEGSGVVVETGADVSKVRAGDRVLLGWIKSSGLDAPGPDYECSDGVLHAGAITTFNEYALVSENRCLALPDEIPLDVAVLFGCAIPTGAGIVTNELEPAPGSSIAIFGLGGVGLSALMATRLFDWAEVFAIDVSASKLELAREFGATRTIDASRQDPVAELRGATGGLGVDFSVEASGLVAVIEAAFTSVRPAGGLCVFASHPEHGEVLRLDPHELIRGKRIRGTWGGACDPDKDIPRFLELYRQGLLPLEMLVAERYALDDVNRALDGLERGRVARPLLEINPSLGVAL